MHQMLPQHQDPNKRSIPSPMAGGMHRKGVERISLHERIHGTPPPSGWENRKVAPPALEQPPAIKHCWVTDENGRLPGLLLEWRRTAEGWQGRVLRPAFDGGAWGIV